jgi:hypothetical protein
MVIHWKRVIACAVFFWVWYVGPGIFSYFEAAPVCNPLKVEACEP